LEHHAGLTPDLGDVAQVVAHLDAIDDDAAGGRASRAG
jgi:hypothetical protein